jgi:hypothetical protein
MDRAFRQLVRRIPAAQSKDNCALDKLVERNADAIGEGFDAGLDVAIEVKRY